jgi:Methylated DNA-protein cysteine methyltransferase
VPCHRVVAANGALTGFSAPGGLATKRRMLELEGAPGYGQQALFGDERAVSSGVAGGPLGTGMGTRACPGRWD